MSAHARARAIARFLRLYRSIRDFVFRVLRGIVWPYVDAGIRLLLAKTSVVSGVMTLAGWHMARHLASGEDLNVWQPFVSAYLGVSIEIIGGALLALGLMTRYAALSILVLTWISPNFPSSDTHLYWVALCGWFVVCGAGPLSIDALFRRGLGDSALPLISRVVRGSEWVRSRIGPLCLFALRAWFAVAMLAGTEAPASNRAWEVWLPLQAATHEPYILAMVGGALLLIGFATRYVAAILFLGFSADAMMQAQTMQQIYPLICLTLFVIHGAGRLSLDALCERLLVRRLPELDGRPAFALENVPRVVIVGAGFGGIACATALRNVRASITVIDRANHHLFQPLLYQVATAALSPGDIATPVRPMFRESFNTRVLWGSVDAVDTARSIVRMGTHSVPYDFLVLATGAAHSYFGKDQWASFAPGLKRIEDATEIRRRILTAFERAELTDDAAESEALLTFLIVGGGATGVELAGAIAELARYGMDKDFRNFDPAKARVILVQSAPRLLPAFTETLAGRARRSLEKLGVEVMVGSRVEDIDASGVVVSGRHIAARTVLWAAGVMASPAATWLRTEADGSGRIKVGEDLSVPTLPNVFAIGDTALSSAWRGQSVPGLAPAAKQGGDYVASVIRARIEAGRTPQPFVYRHRGSLATIGRQAAVADFGRIKLWGAPAWWLWGVVHVAFLVGIRSRVSTMLNWFWSYLAYSGGIRLITGEDRAPPLAGTE